MPVTARLSKLFYDRFGDEVVGELVDWLNSTDSDYRTALRDLNDTNFARFDAELDVRLTAVERAVDRLGAELREYTERALKEQTRWMFVAWGSLLIPIIGLWFRG